MATVNHAKTVAGWLYTGLCVRRLESCVRTPAVDVLVLGESDIGTDPHVTVID